MAWEPITNVEQLIARVEGSSLDYKTAYDLSKRETLYDIAKDVAAFANAYGGSIVVGIVEKGGKPVRVDGVTEVLRLKERLRDALGTYCAPLPATPEDHVIAVTPDDARRILAPSGASPPNAPVNVVTLNVAADPRAPIGVRHFDPQIDKGKGGPVEDAWRFPVRIADHTGFLNPTELPMWMNTHERRIAIHLRRAFQAEGVRVLVHCRKGGELDKTYERPLVLTNVDESRMCAKLADAAASGGEIVIPFSFILSLWQSPSGTWEMAVNGGVQRMDGVETRLAFRPYLGGA